MAGIDASAGGLHAIQEFSEAMPEEIPEVALVIVSHLDPKQHSIMPDLIQKHTSLAVLSVENGMEIQSRRVYVLPPDNDIELADGRLSLIKQERTDGTVGVQSIKGNLGMVMVQEPASAKFDAMLQSAIATGCRFSR